MIKGRAISYRENVCLSKKVIFCNICLPMEVYFLGQKFRLVTVCIQKKRQKKLFIKHKNCQEFTYNVHSVERLAFDLHRCLRHKTCDYF